jgi:hypothetical protein
MVCEWSWLDWSRRCRRNELETRRLWKEDAEKGEDVMRGSDILVVIFNDLGGCWTWQQLSQFFKMVFLRHVEFDGRRRHSSRETKPFWPVDRWIKSALQGATRSIYATLAGVGGTTLLYCTSYPALACGRLVQGGVALCSRCRLELFVNGLLVLGPSSDSHTVPDSVCSLFNDSPRDLLTVVHLHLTLDRGGEAAKMPSRAFQVRLE